MQLQKLTLVNFGKHRELVIDFDGKSAEIYGENESGKTTIADAYWWTLFGKSISGIANFSPKAREGTGYAHNLSYGAEIVIKSDNGVIVTLGRFLREKYTKIKGSLIAHYEGDTTDYYVDGVPKKEKEYDARVVQIIGDQTRAKILSSATEFLGREFKWEERRKIVLEVSGDVSDAEVITSNPELAELPKILEMPGDSGQQYTIEEYIEKAKSELSEIKKELEYIPIKITEADHAIKEIPENPPKDVGADLAAINQLIADAELEIAYAHATTDNEAATELRLEIKCVEMELATAKTAHAQAGATINADALAKIKGFELQTTDVSLAKTDVENAATNAERKVADLKQRRKELIKRNEEITARVWDAGRETCPSCSQTLPAERVESMRAEFNKKKSDDLESLTAQGKKECSKEMITDMEAQRDGHKAEAEAKGRELTDLMDARDALKKTITEAVAFDTTDTYKTLTARIAELTQQEREGETATAQANATKITAIEAKKAEMVKELDRLNTVKLAIQSGEAQRTRIAELREQQKTLAIADEDLQRGIHLCEKFDTAKMEMLDCAINAKFTAVKFRMFVNQLNGGIRKDCEVLVPSKDKTAWVPFSGGSNRGANANAGLEIISVLSKHWGQTLPVVVDNAESVSDWVDTGVQLIQLIVTRTDDKLRVEVK
jgi:hypothetical protein